MRVHSQEERATLTINRQRNNSLPNSKSFAYYGFEENVILFSVRLINFLSTHNSLSNYIYTYIFLKTALVLIRYLTHIQLRKEKII